MKNKWPSDDQMDRWMNRTLSAEELNQLESDRGLEDLKQITQAAEQLVVPARWTTEEAWNMLQNRIQQGETPESETLIVNLDTRPSGARMRPLYYAVAVAAAVIMLVLVFLPGNNRTEYITAAGEIQTVTLPDQSQVMLNAGSTLSFSEEEWSANPYVMLEGEAQFIGPHADGFMVKTSSDHTVEVLGTTFNVFARNNSLQVFCTEGKVQVSGIESENPVVVDAGYFLEKNGRSQPNLRKFENEEIPQWTLGIFKFENAPLQTVLQEIERQFAIRIVIEQDVDVNRNFSGEFQRSLEDSLSAEARTQALEDVVFPMGYNFSWENDQTVRLSR